MAKSHLKLVSPTTVNRTVTPRRKPNAELRTREYLTEAEIERLMKSAKDNRYGHRDATMILVAYRHGFRASELVDLRWDQVDFATATMAVHRAKRGTPATHPIRGDEFVPFESSSGSKSPNRPSYSHQNLNGISPTSSVTFSRRFDRPAVSPVSFALEDNVQEKTDK